MPKQRRKRPQKTYREPVPGEWKSDGEGWSGLKVTMACIGVIGAIGFLAWQSLNATGVLGAISAMLFAIGPQVWEVFKQIGGD